MILKVNRLEFLKQIKILDKIIHENKIRPIISNIYIEAKNGIIQFYGTNLETTITTTMECDAEAECKAVFQHLLVEEYLKELKDEDVFLNIEKDILKIETSDSSSEFVLLDVEEYPKMQEQIIPSEELELKINKLDLIESIEKVKFSSSASQDNLAINCIRVEISSGKIKFITTDTYRLSYFEKEYEDKSIDIGVSLPTNAMDILSKLLKNEKEEMVSFGIKSKHIHFNIGNVSMASRIIDLPFPNYKAILEIDSYDKNLQIEKDDFEKMLKRIIVFVKNNYESKFGAIFNISSEEMLIEGSGELAKAKESIKLDYKGESLRISLNVKFLLDYIQSSDNGILNIELKSTTEAVRIKNINEENYIYIVMPLALKN